MTKIIIILVVVALLIGGAYYLGTRSAEEPEPVVTIIDLTDSERKQIMQDARLNWIPLDSAWALAESSVRDSVNIITFWNIEDSINIKDSAVIVYIPYFEADDTTVIFDEIDTTQQIRVQLSLAIKPRYFPTYRKFLTDVKLNELTITQEKQIESWWKHRWVVYAGYGFGPVYRDGWFLAHGFQVGIGYRIY